MNYYFETAPAIELNKKIQQQLIELDRKKLEPADNLHYDINADKVLKIIESRLLDKSNFEKFYGKNLSNLASCVTWNLPTDLEKEIFHNYQDFFKLVDEVPDIRLQSIFGNQLPLHIDKDRTVSIIHPLQNHSNTWTEFYDHNDEIDQWQQHYLLLQDKLWPNCDSVWDIQNLPTVVKEEILKNSYTLQLVNGQTNDYRSVGDPVKLNKVCQVNIELFPCILNVNKWHGIYCPTPLTETNPRLSLFFKWRKASFTQVVDAYHQYVQSKI